MDLNEAILLGILYTDGCLSRKGKNGWRLYLGNTSWEIITAFKVAVMGLFKLPEYRVRISRKIVNDNPFYIVVVDSVEIGRVLNKKYGTFRTLKYSLNNKTSIYPTASLPSILDEDKTILCSFLKVAFSCDGGVNLYIAYNRYKWLIRNVYLACQHPTLVKQYSFFLRKLGIRNKILWKDELIRIQGKQDLEKFAKTVGFMKGVKITQNSAYWQGIEKQKVLELAIKSYGNPQLIFNLPQFRVKI